MSDSLRSTLAEHRRLWIGQRQQEALDLLERELMTATTPRDRLAITALRVISHGMPLLGASLHDGSPGFLALRAQLRDLVDAYDRCDAEDLAAVELLDPDRFADMQDATFLEPVRDLLARMERGETVSAPDSPTQKAMRAMELGRLGQHREEIAALEEALAMERGAAERMVIAQLISSTYMHRVLGRDPEPSTPEYAEARRHLRVALEAYDHAPEAARSQFEKSNNVSGLRAILAAMERGEAMSDEAPATAPAARGCLGAVVVWALATSIALGVLVASHSLLAGPPRP